MTRGYEIAGEVMVMVSQTVTAAGIVGVNGITSDLNQANGSPSTLGLTDSQTRIIPQFSHFDIPADDFGKEVPPEVLWMLGTCSVDMLLVHLDRNILNLVVRESMGGGVPSFLAGAGTPMHGHFCVLTLQSQNSGKSWTWPTAYLSATPMEFPIGPERSLVRLRWRAIPHKPVASEVVSAGAQLWTNQ